MGDATFKSSVRHHLDSAPPALTEPGCVEGRGEKLRRNHRVGPLGTGDAGNLGPPAATNAIHTKSFRPRSLVSARRRAPVKDRDRRTSPRTAGYQRRLSFERWISDFVPTLAGRSCWNFTARGWPMSVAKMDHLRRELSEPSETWVTHPPNPSRPPPPASHEGYVPFLCAGVSSQLADIA